MKNFKCIIEKNGFRSNDKTDTIESVRILIVDRTEVMNELCEKGVMCKYLGTAFDYEEYYFQASNTVKATKKALNHYFKQDLVEMNKFKILRLLAKEGSL